MMPIFNYLVRFGLLLLRVIIVPVTRLAQIGQYKLLPPIGNTLVLNSGKKLVQMIKNKEVSSEEVVRAFIDRCKQVNPILNAIVQDRFDAAIKDAQLVDRLISKGDDVSKYPLLGLPITVKESIAVEGLSNNAGVVCPEGQHIATSDAFSVECVKKAGAIPILVSNTPELCMNWETYNKVSGTTRNPYDTRRTPAGSSGGEAALISSGGSIMGIASDIGGSLRLPAMFTGIFGHKPSPGVVSPAGHVPDCISKDWYKFFTIGPMVRYAEDLPILLKAISYPDGPNLMLDQSVDINKLNIFYMENDGGSIIVDDISECVSTAMKKAITGLENKFKIEIKKVSIDKMKYAFNFAVSILLGIDGVENIYTDKGNPEKMKNVYTKFMKAMFCSSNVTIGPTLYGPIKRILGDVSDDKKRKIMQCNKELQDEFQNLLGSNGVFLYPTFPNVAHFHKEGLGNFTNALYMCIFNTLGLPVTNCPLGLNSDGLPVGIQIVANPLQDRLTIAVAKELEEIMGGWVPPPFQEIKTEEQLLTAH
ncbi:fatty-acid amide hydrolase 2-A-like [Chrysoperla carnea]|uniref:fatty-acid amide hydrolase 2-A-like n=1 Tax=Chrysoperla carnea TaxID=189513 RepID=UPI001D08169E|nr:fatty-acid amide hydrolase 2-A-like [Chrysoperla carnea]